MKKSKEIALCAICAGFSLIFMLAGAFISVLDYSAIFMASMTTMVLLAKKSWKGGLMTYLATLCLSAIFFVGYRPELVLTYGIFFGIHPTVNYIFKEKNFNQVLAFIIKLVWFIGSVLLIYTLFSAFLFEESVLTNQTFQKYAYLILAAGSALLFVAYDFIMIRFQTAIDKIVEKLKL
ncbi:MAG: hypothetical protein IJY84_00565 [Clostridia bacterium]|nr:hypothetical protein [Clostridia bacterium]